MREEVPCRSRRQHPCQFIDAGIARFGDHEVTLVLVEVDVEFDGFEGVVFGDGDFGGARGERESVFGPAFADPTLGVDF